MMMIPWNSFQEYIQLHQICIQNLVDIVQKGVMTKEMAESILPKSFKQIHELISKILKDNSDPNDKEA